MTDKQNIRRWQFRRYFLAYWLAEILSKKTNIAKNTALIYIAECEEQAMKEKGIKYPFEESDS